LVSGSNTWSRMAATVVDMGIIISHRNRRRQEIPLR
jgi:hypothetical protein